MEKSKMYSAAQQEKSEGNFHQALTIYDRILECADNDSNVDGETFKALLGKAQVLILLKRYKDSVDCYRGALDISGLNASHVKQFIDCLVESETFVPLVPDQLGKVNCQSCTGIFVEPVTLQCGHTICKNCRTKLDISCKVCNQPIGQFRVKVNVQLQEIVSKYFPKEVQASCLRLQGNALLKDGKSKLALDKYLEAIKLDPNDPLLNSNIAHLMIQNGNFEQGLQYASIACKERPGWPKGFYRRGCALIGLNKRSEAVFSFLQCLAKDPTNGVVYKLVTEILQSLFDEYSNADSDSTVKLSWMTEIMELFEQMEKPQEPEEPSEKKVKFHETKLDSQDFECTLCCRYFYEPVTTPCGHVFCRSCLNRSLDHRPECPICRSSLSQVLASENQNITVSIEQLMQMHLADEYEKRKQIHLKEMENLASVASNTEDDIPIFVCTMAFPLMPCPLHIFEPRYRLMVRQCMESGSRQFGMCDYDEENGFAQYGIMLEILDVQFLPDGRSLLNTTGGRRFKVLSKGKRDGYSVAKVEWIVDGPVAQEEEGELKNLLKDVFEEATNWFNSLPLLIRRKIINSVSEIPNWQEDADKMPHGPKWLWWLITVCPMDPKSQLNMLGIKSLKERLLKMRSIIAAIS